jgi:putative transposase
VGISRTVLHYEPKVQPENEVLQGRIVELAQVRRRFGYRRFHALLRREGVEANHKRVFRLYQEAAWLYGGVASVMAWPSSGRSWNCPMVE